MWFRGGYSGKRVLIKPLVVLAVMLLLIAGGIWWIDNQDPHLLLATSRPVDLLENPSPQYYAFPNSVVTVLEPGTWLKVIKLRYGKDYVAYKVRLPDGRSGYIIGGWGVNVHETDDEGRAR